MFPTADFCRIYYFKAHMPVTSREGDNPIRTLGGNRSWTEIGTRDYAVKIRNLCAARNAAGQVSQCVFTSECFGDRDINDVFRSLLGASFSPGLYTF